MTHTSAQLCLVIFSFAHVAEWNRGVWEEDGKIVWTWCDYPTHAPQSVLVDSNIIHCAALFYWMFLQCKCDTFFFLSVSIHESVSQHLQQPLMTFESFYKFGIWNVTASIIKPTRLWKENWYLWVQLQGKWCLTKVQLFKIFIYVYM